MQTTVTSIVCDPKITVIYDNRCSNKILKEGFGFSCMVEWKTHKILFDTGGNQEAFFGNIGKLNIQLEDITHVIFSHHHWDHTTALAEVLSKIKEKSRVYIPEVFSASLESQVPKKLHLEKVTTFKQIEQDVYAFVLKGGYWCTSIYEQFLVLDTPKGLIILTGCAHPGIVSIIKTALRQLNRQKVHMVIGGFHLHHSWAYTSARVVRQFQELGVEKVAPCHCAGNIAIDQFQEAFRDNFISVGTGTVLGGTTAL